MLVTLASRPLERQSAIARPRQSVTHPARPPASPPIVLCCLWSVPAAHGSLMASVFAVAYHLLRCPPILCHSLLCLRSGCPHPQVGARLEARGSEQSTMGSSHKGFGQLIVSRHEPGVAIEFHREARMGHWPQPEEDCGTVDAGELARGGRRDCRSQGRSFSVSFDFPFSRCAVTPGAPRWPRRLSTDGVDHDRSHCRGAQSCARAVVAASSRDVMLMHVTPRSAAGWDVARGDRRCALLSGGAPARAAWAGPRYLARRPSNVARVARDDWEALVRGGGCPSCGG
ncbi:hypothetical protein C8Q80DRAFT_28054 [Daedaleopsis nitida]|nr:hypothetical protein C8Q80DRAFT_28054 [Daedaleopsis nitida]